MADFEYINKNVIIELLQQYNIDDADIEEIYEQDSFIEYTKKLCNLYMKLLDEGTDNALKTAYSLGGIIIFNLRKFVVKKDITMLIGGTDANNDNLKVSKIPLTSLLNNPSTFKIKENSLLLHSAIESYNSLNQTINRQQSAVWKKILDASQLTGHGDFTTKNGADATMTIDNKEEPLYKRIDIDTNVYYRYVGKNIYSYYDIGNWYQFFNRGWLFEHFMSKWSNATSIMRKDMILESNGSHPVAIAIDKTDKIPGYKGGDFRGRGGDYQAKYGNQQIITKKSIQLVMNTIIKALNEYTLEKKKNKKELSKKLVELYTSKYNMDLEGNLEQINNAYDKKVEQLINSLIRRI